MLRQFLGYSLPQAGTFVGKPLHSIEEMANKKDPKVERLTLVSSRLEHL